MPIPVEKVCAVIENKYKAIVIIAKEARRLNKLLKEKGEPFSEKPTKLSLKKLIKGEIKYIEEE